MEKVKIQCCILSPKLWSASLFNEAPFNSIESFAKIKLYKNTWNVMYICLFYDVVDQSNSLFTGYQSNRIPLPPPHPVSTFYKACLARLIRKPKSFLIS